MDATAANIGASEMKCHLFVAMLFTCAGAAADAQSLLPSATTLDGKVMTGYQGWFFTPGDGSDRGWVHYGPGEFRPGLATVDLWPDMTEMEADERYPTEFRHANGETATVFSSRHPKTVDRHFKWMEQYGIDGVFLQRFGVEVRRPGSKSHKAVNAVMDNVRHAAQAHGRTWTVMYDLSGLKADEIASVVKEDWKQLVDQAKVTRDPFYQWHRSKPVVAVWGVGFNDKRAYSLAECSDLVEFLKHDSGYGGNTVMLGLPYYWREQTRDAVSDPALHDLIRKADIVSPWSVGRYNTGDGFLQNQLLTTVRPDRAWCADNRLDYMPVIFPGFRWINLMRHRGKDAAGQTIDRAGGGFFWSQGAGHLREGARMLYLAMFDEIDEGTALFKVTNNPPVGPTQFGTYDGLPPDHYLWLSGQLAQALKNQSMPPAIQPDRRKP